MADENITSADTQEGAQQQATDAQLLDDLTSLQQATEGMDEAQADGQVATNNEGDADNPSMTRPDDEFKDQRGLPEGGTTDTFALDNTDLQNSNEQSTTTDVQFTAQNTTQDATAINLDNVQIEIEGAEGEQSSSGSTRSTTSSTTTTADAPAAQTPTTLTDPAGPTPTDPPPTVPDTTPDTPTNPTPTPPTSGTEESDGGENSSTSVTPTLSIFAVSDTNPGGWTPYTLDGKTVYISLSSSFTEPNPNGSPVIAQYIVLVAEVGFAANGVTPVVTVLPYETQVTYKGTVNVKTTDNTATSGADYSPISKPVSIATRFDAPILDDVYKDSGETYQVSITAGTYSLDNTFATSTTPVTTTINDDADPTIITLSDPAPVADGATNLTITATVSSPVTGTDLVITLSNGSTITIPVGQTTGTTAPFAETANNTNLQTEKYPVSISSTTGGNYEALSTTDTSEITVIRTPELTLRKVADVTTDFGGTSDGNQAVNGETGEFVDSALDVIAYTLTATNAGNVDLTNVKISDAMFGRTGISDVTITVYGPDGSDADENPDLITTKTASASDYEAGKLVIPNLAVGQYAEVTYTYTVQGTDITSQGNDGDGDDAGTANDGADYDIDNAAQAFSTQDNSTVQYEVVPIKTPELTLRKVADVTTDFGGTSDGNQAVNGETGEFVDSALDVIAYTLTATNAGNVDLTNVKISDAMFGRTGISDVTITVYGPDGSDADENPDLITTKTASASDYEAGKLVIPNLAVGQYAEVTYTYTVQGTDITSQGNDGDGDDAGTANDGADYDIDNAAQAFSTQDNSTVQYEVVPIKTPELTLRKVADVTTDFGGTSDGNQAVNGETGEFVDSALDVIAYTLTATNAGNVDLTNVKISDAMFGRTGISDVTITVYGPDGSDADENPDLITTKTASASDYEAGKLVIPNLAVGQYAEVTYTYTVQGTDITSQGNDGDGDDAGTANDGADYDIDNAAQAFSTQDNSTVQYEVVPIKTPELTLRKVADVTTDFGGTSDGNQAVNGETGEFVDSALDVIAYTLTATNAGNVDLTNVKISDAMFGRTGISDVTITVYGPDGSDADENPDLITTKTASASDYEAGKLVIPNLAVGQYAEVTYTYTVQGTDITSQGNDGDGDDAGTANDGADYDIDNAAQAFSTQDNSTVQYEVVPIKTPELTLRKVADVTTDFGGTSDGNQAVNGETGEFVDSALDVIAYTLTATNAGNVDLTNVKISDAMFGRTGISDVTITVYGPDGSDADENPDLITTKTASASDYEAGKLVIPNLAVGQYAEVTYTYTVQGTDITSQGNDGDGDDAGTANDGADYDIDNAAQAFSTQDNSTVQYEVVPIKTPELTLRKVADVTTDFGGTSDGNQAVNGETGEFVDSALDVIAYTLTATNAGNVDLTNVKISDAMFGRTGISDVTITVYGPDGSDADENPDLITTKTASASDYEAGKLVIPNLAVGQYAEVTYTYTVQGTDITSQGNDGDGDDAGTANDGADYDIDNAAQAFSTQDNSTVQYEVVPIKTPELTLRKVADVTTDFGGTSDGNQAVNGETGEFVDSALDVIAYTLTATNAGNVDLTNVKISDAMFGRTGISDVTITVYGPDGSDADENPDLITTKTASASDYEAGKLVIPNLAVGQYAEVTYTYTVQGTDITSQGNDGDGDDAGTANDGADYDIDNAAQAFSTQDNSTVQYEVVPIKTPELTLRKVADVTTDFGGTSDGNQAVNGETGEFVDSALDVIAYTLTATNAGNVDLTNVKISDAMFGRTGISDVTITVYGPDGSDADENPDLITTKTASASDYEAGKLVIPNLAVGQYAEVTYTYTVQGTDITSQGNDGDGDDAGTANDGADYDIDNAAQAFSTQDNSTVQYEVVPIKTPELTLRKVADVTTDFGGTSDGNQAVNGETGEFVDSALDVIAYTLTATNAGNVDLTNVKISDAMFGRTGISDVTITVYGPDGSDADENPDLITTKTASASDYEAGKLVIPNLAVGQYAEVTYTYTVQGTDITSQGNDGDGDDAGTANDGADYDIDNAAQAFSTQDNSTVQYEVVPIKTPELTLRKVADVTTDFGGTSDGNQAVNGETGEFVDSALDVIAYTLTATNAGNVDLTNVKISDAMFGRTGISDVTITVYGPDGSDADENPDLITTKTASASDYEAGKLVIPNLAVGQYAEVTYTYTVQGTDITSQGNDGDGDDAGTANDGADYDIDNAAQAFSTQDNSTVQYEVVPIKTPELTLRKVADVTTDFGGTSDGDLLINGVIGNFVDSALDVIAYTLTATNAGNVDLTNVKISDAMFGRTGISDVTITVYGPDGSDADENPDLITTKTASASDYEAGKLVIPNLAVGQYAEVTYTYTVQGTDITSQGNDGDGDDAGTANDGADYDIDNAAQAFSTQDNSSIEYAITEINLHPDVSIEKTALVTSVSGAGSIIDYELLVTNQGGENLTGIKVGDTMFGRTGISAVTIKIYGPDGTGATIDADLDPDLLRTPTVTYDAAGKLVVGNLGVGEYAVVTYSYTVQGNDLGAIVDTTRSVFDYIDSNRGPIGSEVDFGYGSFEAYVNENNVNPYATGGRAEDIYVNVDNTGRAIGVGAGVMSGDRNANSDHLKAVFDLSTYNNDKSLVEGASIVFTNSKDVELAFKVESCVADASPFYGSIFISERGEVSLREVVNGQTTDVRVGGQTVSVGVLSGTSVQAESSPLVTFEAASAGSAFGAGWSFTVTEAPGPGGAQNKLYTLNVETGDDYLKSFDFWVVGEIDANNLEQIKVVDVIFDTLDFSAKDLINTATVTSNEDNSFLGDLTSDEVDQANVTIFNGISVIDANLAIALGEDSNFTVKDTYENISAALNPKFFKKLIGGSDGLTLVDDAGEPLTDADREDALNNLRDQIDLLDLRNPYVISVTDTVSNSVSNSSNPFIFKVEFSEALSRTLTVDDFNVTNGVVTSVNEDVNIANLYNVTVTPSSNLLGNVVLSISANNLTDAAGNQLIKDFPSNQGIQAFDMVAPTATVTIIPKVTGKNPTPPYLEVISTEIGSAYVVSTSANLSTISETVINSLRPTTQWNSVEIKVAGEKYLIDCSTDLNLTASGLNYRLYVFDNAGNYVVLGDFNITNGGVVNKINPITLDLNNNGIEYLSTSAGVTYDYNGDGVAESTAWVSPEDGLLALSQEDGSLKIVFSTQDGETDLQGLAKIYDSNQDGQLDELDTFFNQFGVWQDADSDGVVDSGEFQSLTDREIVSLDLVSDGVERTEANGDVFVYGQTTYTKADGTTGLADDAAFVVRSSDEATSKTIQIGNSGEVVHVPDFGTNDQIDLSTILANAAITRDNLKDYVQLVDGENGTVLNIDTTGHGGEGGWVQVASLDNVHVSQTGVNMFFDPTNQTIDFTQSSPDEWKVEDGDTPV